MNEAFKDARDLLCEYLSKDKDVHIDYDHHPVILAFDDAVNNPLILMAPCPCVGMRSEAVDIAMQQRESIETICDRVAKDLGFLMRFTPTGDDDVVVKAVQEVVGKAIKQLKERKAP